ncbi:chemokine (C motif) receptor 1a, duplicate 1 [Acanthochromis polyacanthus]|uniref:chemokine (C motif) receptor 1a, duplicate 1 n=1 Tax=Acanthochromis polyacanthus TaxID=80966 RepID=UPI002234B7E7|nr:chemokine (C motif) receptor 1a, duplicate 1 [Acanthochromis polyacanthus]
MNDFFNYSLEYDEDDDDDGFCEKGEVVKFGSIAIPIFFSIVITLSLTGNILVLVILGLYENLKSLTNIFILNLAISDIVFTTGLPFWAIYHIWGWLFPEAFCKIVTFVFFTGFYSSILFLTIMTIHRYVAVVHPLSDLRTQKRSTGVFVSFLMWVISIGAAMPSLLYSSLVTVHHKDKHSVGCEYSSMQWRTISILQQNVFFMVAFTVMAFCYIRILRRITGARSHTKNRAVKLVFCIVAVFFMGWVPYNVVIFLKVLDDRLIPPFAECDASINLDYAFHVCRLIAFSHCCLNPVFYAFVGVKFRSHLKSMLHRLFRAQSSPSPVEEQQVRLQNFVSQGSMY